MKKILLFLFTISISVALSAQSDLLVNFTGQQIENYLSLSFTVKRGITCTGAEVQRSLDDIQYETIITIEGVCGSDSSEQSYFVLDPTAAKNQYNYYRIHMGQLGFSQSIKLWFVDYGNAFAVISNPDGSATVYFSNPDHHNLMFSLFNLQGQILQTIQTNGDAINLSRELFPSLVYFFRVANEHQALFSGKIAVR